MGRPGRWGLTARSLNTGQVGCLEFLESGLIGRALQPTCSQMANKVLQDILNRLLAQGTTPLFQPHILPLYIIQKVNTPKPSPFVLLLLCVISLPVDSFLFMAYYPVFFWVLFFCWLNCGFKGTILYFLF